MTTAAMVSYRSSTLSNEILCGVFTGIAMPDLQNLISPNLCQNDTALHGKIHKHKRVMNLQHQLGNTARANGSSKRRKQVYWSKTRINQRLFTKSKDGHKQQNRSRLRKMTIASWDDHQQYQQLAATSKNDKDCQGQQQPTALLTPHMPPSPSQGKPPPTKTGRLIQPNNLLRVLIANIQSLSPKSDHLMRPG